jgi:hypothetical protein
MAMLCTLPCNICSNFVLLLMCQKTLMHADVEVAFQVKQVKCTMHHGPLIGSIALHTFGKPSFLCGNSKECPFSSIKGHAQEDCNKYKGACANTIKLVNNCQVDKCGGCNKCKAKANCAKAKEEKVVK